MEMFEEEEVEVVATGKSKRPKASAVSSKPKTQKKPEKMEKTEKAEPVVEPTLNPVEKVEKAAPPEAFKPEKQREEPIMFNPPVVSTV